MAIAFALALAASVGVYGASIQSSDATPQSSAIMATGVPLSWAPNWLARSLSRAIADATDPRERSKETGAPVD